MPRLPLLESLSRLVRLASIVAVLFVFIGLIGFLSDEVRDSSKVNATTDVAPKGEPAAAGVTVVDISAPDPPKAVERAREGQHTSAREFIDDVGDVIMSPFTWIAKGSRPWVKRILYSGLALLLYGLIAQLLADLMRRSSDSTRRAAAGKQNEEEARKRRESGEYVSPA